MMRGNPLLNRLDTIQDAAPRAAAGDVLTAPLVADRALVLVLLHLAVGAAGWVAMSSRPIGDNGWPDLGTNLVGVSSLVFAVAVMLFGAFKPVSSVIAAGLFAIALGLLFAWAAVVFDSALPGFLPNSPLAVVLSGLAALAVKRSHWGRLPGFVRFAAAFAAGLVALVVVNAALFAAGTDLGLFGSDGPFPWHVWFVVVLLCAGAVFAVRADLRQVDAYANTGAPARFAWAAAVGITADLLCMYGWRLFEFRTKYRSEHVYTGTDWGSSDSSDSSGSDD